ncbi:hypothetical protein [Mycolicibacterium litorale]|uniref:Uncharacterized protein n=1 Tax=Mycolicibacterium litorale TaxID=758802 RepID=A0AAD1MXN8_9MYCO|nr:hypothetical protein [Mycolicibacterium litorale]MCV7418487.1 hypothetical protein [Mycolicibacterium litorale]TDY06116.1 hypothetical protein BCL50_2432 [Mycolicibacterium litorale]BBY19741.1 hypothetical protein MLIT_53330 [Mycolicibacterium litorale]
MSWIAQALFGVVWTVSGVAIGLGPPLSETGRGASSPLVGWALTAFGVYQIVLAFRRSVDPPGEPDRRPAHASGRAPDRRTAIGIPVAFALCAAAGAGGIWWGIAAGRPTVMWFGVAMFSMVIAAYPSFVDMVRHRLRRR